MKIYKALVSAVSMLTISISSAYAFNSSIESKFDFNNDKVIDGFDWVEMSMFDKYDLISSYHNDSFRMMPISDNLKEREISKVITVLNYYYKGANSENKKMGVWDTYNLMIE